MKKRTYRALCFLEIMAIVAIFLVLSVSAQDYAMREFKEYLRNPSPRSLQVFHDKKYEEVRIREKIALSIACIAVVLAIPIWRNRSAKPSGQS